MKKLGVFLFCAISTLALNATETVKVGCIFSLTGDMQMFGNQLKDGVQLRLKEQQSNPGRFNYQVTYEDDGRSAVNAVLAYRKLTQIDKSETVLCNWSGLANAVAPIAAKDKKLFMSISWDDTTAADKLAFIECTQPIPQATLLANALKATGSKKIAILCMVQQGFLAMEKQFVIRAKELGMETMTIKFNNEERNFRGQLLKFYDYKPDAYVVLGFQPMFELAVKRIRETDKQIVVTSVEGYCFVDDMKPYNGSFYVEGNEPTAEFAARFNKATGKIAEGYVGLGYDMMGLTIKAYEQAGEKLGRKPTPAEAAEALESMKEYSGATGALNVGGTRIIQSPAVIKYIENGHASVVSLEELKAKKGK